ncbi:hypothetical protein [Streptomyces sp. NPDC085479]|uniref:hypothetical protein n=1 Tax=Streptomyces sp. NPDC085479 TaxID=3365726 RepID=UPI0037CDA2F3
MTRPPARRAATRPAAAHPRVDGVTTSEASAGPRPLAPARVRSAGWPLAAVAAVFTLAQLALAVPGTGLGWDEAVYVSQVGGNAPPAYFSAPRARGVTYLVAPVAAFTASTTAIRVYLALLSGAALLGALRVWRPLLPDRVLVVAGALFAGLWVTLFYGPRVMPNLWCAFGALAAVGLLPRAARDRRALAGLGAAVAAVTLLRPSDGLWLALPLLAATLLVPAWRRPRVPAVTAAGLFLGAVPWEVEAYTSYSGLVARLHRAGEIQGTMGWYFSVDDHVRALAGRTLCRPCDIAWAHPWTGFWWFLLPFAVLGGLAAARRAGRAAPVLLATATAASLAAPYLFTLGYAAPRFLLPAYALLALPAAECALLVWSAARTARRPRLATGLLAVLLVAHLGVQYAVLDRTVGYSRSVRAQFTGIAAALHGLGVRPPCLVTGREYVPIGYFTGCSSRQPRGHDGSITEAGLAAAARTTPLAVVVHAGRTPPGYARGWPRTRLPSAPGWRRFDAYVSPGTTAPAAP